MPLLAAALVFVAIVVLVIGLWWARLPARHVSDRLRKVGQTVSGIDTDLFTSPADNRIYQLYWWKKLGRYIVCRYDDNARLEIVGQFFERSTAIAEALGGIAAN